MKRGRFGLWSGLAFAEGEACLRGPLEGVASLSAEVGYVHMGGRVVRQKADARAAGQGLHPFAQAQNRERAEQAQGVHLKVYGIVHLLSLISPDGSGIVIGERASHDRHPPPRSVHPRV